MHLYIKPYYLYVKWFLKKKTSIKKAETQLHNASAYSVTYWFRGYCYTVTGGALIIGSPFRLSKNNYINDTLYKIIVNLGFVDNL